MIIKGYTNFGFNHSYYFIICNNVLLFKTDNNQEITHYTSSFWEFIEEYKIKYFANYYGKRPRYYFADETKSENERKTTRQIIKNELRSKRFNDLFEKQLNGDKNNET